MVGLEGKVGELAAGMVADVIVVNGDPVKDIRVLQDRRNIETVIKDGAVVRFAPEVETVRRPYERGQVYSIADLTWDVVHGGDEPGAVERLPWNGREGHELAAEVKEKESTAVLLD